MRGRGRSTGRSGFVRGGSRNAPGTRAARIAMQFSGARATECAYGREMRTAEYGAGEKRGDGAYSPADGRRPNSTGRFTAGPETVRRAAPKAEPSYGLLRSGGPGGRPGPRGRSLSSEGSGAGQDFATPGATRAAGRCPTRSRADPAVRREHPPERGRTPSCFPLCGAAGAWRHRPRLPAACSARTCRTRKRSGNEPPGRRAAEPERRSRERARTPSGARRGRRGRPTSPCSAFLRSLSRSIRLVERNTQAARRIAAAGLHSNSPN